MREAQEADQPAWLRLMCARVDRPLRADWVQAAVAGKRKAPLRRIQARRAQKG